MRPNYYPATDSATARAVAKIVGVVYDAQTQDWPIEAADGERTGEFLSYYKKEETPQRRLAIAELIVASLDEAEDPVALRLISSRNAGPY